MNLKSWIDRLELKHVFFAGLHNVHAIQDNIFTIFHSTVICKIFLRNSSFINWLIDEIYETITWFSFFAL